MGLELEGCHSLSLGHGSLRRQAVPVDDCARKSRILLFLGNQFCSMGQGTEVRITMSWGSFWLAWQSWSPGAVLPAVFTAFQFHDANVNCDGI